MALVKVIPHEYNSVSGKSVLINTDFITSVVPASNWDHERDVVLTFAAPVSGATAHRPHRVHHSLAEFTPSPNKWTLRVRNDCVPAIEAGMKRNDGEYRG